MGTTAKTPQPPSTSAGEALHRISALLDTGSFVELSQLAECGVVTGYGAVEGRLVYVYGQYGAVNAAHAAKIARLYESAMRMGAPIVGILGSKGMKVDDGLRVLDAYGRIFTCMAECSGVVPQIAVVAEVCMGVASYIPALSDFVVMPEQGATLLLQSPATSPEQAAKTATAAKIGSASAAAKSGLAHFTAPTVSDAMLTVKELLAYLPSNNLDEAPLGMFLDDTERPADAFTQPALPVLDVITQLADNLRFLECRRAYEPTVCTGFARLNGYSVGIVANNGALTQGACDKAAAFVRFCDAFNIPLVTLNAAAAYEYPINGQRDAIVCGAKLLSAFAQATVPRVNVICGEALGSPYLMMNSAHIGADVTLAWDSARIAAVDPEAAQKLLGADISAEPALAATKGFADQVICPADTRMLLIATLEMLNSKRAPRHAKKHGSAVL